MSNLPKLLLLTLFLISSVLSSVFSNVAVAEDFEMHGGYKVNGDFQDKVMFSRDHGVVKIGRIGATTPKELELILHELVSLGHKNIEYRMHSKGGLVQAMRIINIQMDIFREQYGVKFTTVVKQKDMCGSACTLIFFNGDKMKIHDDSVWVFHSPRRHIPKRIVDKMIDAEKIYHLTEVMAKQKYFVLSYKDACGNNSLEKFVTNLKDNIISGEDLKKSCKNF